MVPEKKKLVWWKPIVIAVLLFLVGFLVGNIEGVLPDVAQVVGVADLSEISFGVALSLPVLVTAVVKLATNIGLATSEREKKSWNVVTSIVLALLWFTLSSTGVSFVTGLAPILAQVIYNVLLAAGTYQFAKDPLSG